MLDQVLVEVEKQHHPRPCSACHTDDQSLACPRQLAINKLITGYLKTDRLYRSVIKRIYQGRKFAQSHQLSGSQIPDLVVVVEAVSGQDQYWAIYNRIHHPQTASEVLTNPGLIAKAEFAVDDQWRLFDRQVLVLLSPDRLADLVANWPTKGVRIPTTIIDWSDLRQAAVDWSKLALGQSGPSAQLKVNKRRDYQRQALLDCQAHFQNRRRGKLIMPPRTGKTVTSLWLAELIDHRRNLVLVLVPDSTFLGPTLRTFSANAKHRLDWLVIAQDARIVFNGCPYPVITTKKQIKNTLSNLFDQLKLANRLRVVLATYQSLETLIETQTKAKVAFDLVIYDEAHHLVDSWYQPDLVNYLRPKKAFSLRAFKHLFVTSTPTIYGRRTRGWSNNQDVVVEASLANRQLFGQDIHRLSFNDAVKKRLVNDWRVVICEIDQTKIGKTSLKTGLSRLLQIQIQTLVTILQRPQIKLTKIWLPRTKVNPLTLKHLEQLIVYAGFANQPQQIIDYCSTVINQTTKVKLNLTNLSVSSVDCYPNQALEAWSQGGGRRMLVADDQRLIKLQPTLTADGLVYFSSSADAFVVSGALAPALARTADGLSYLVVPVVTRRGFLRRSQNQQAYSNLWLILNALKSYDDGWRFSLGHLKQRPDQFISDRVLSFSPPIKDPNIRRPDRHWLAQQIIEQAAGLTYHQDLINLTKTVSHHYRSQLIRGLNQSTAAQKKLINLRDQLRQQLANPSLSTSATLDVVVGHLVVEPIVRPFIGRNQVARTIKSFVRSNFDDQNLYYRHGHPHWRHLVNHLNQTTLITKTKTEIKQLQRHRRQEVNSIYLEFIQHRSTHKLGLMTTDGSLNSVVDNLAHLLDYCLVLG